MGNKKTEKIETDGPPPKLAFKPVFVIISSLVLLIILLYYGRTYYFRRHFAGFFDKSSEFFILWPYVYWFGMSILLRMVAPLLIIKFIFKENIRDFGYRLKGTNEKAWVYLVFAVLMVPVIIYVSSFPSFQKKYPFIKDIVVNGELKLQIFIIYELLYAAMFMSGESFWRGYIIFGLEKTFGYYAILIMVIPYSMSHFGILAFGYTGKPFAETMGSIIAGVILGYLALRHRSFWYGVLLHWFVAVTMDVTAVLKQIR